ncbi:hypothetical protein CYMTET_48807 [Cymbomonas tetramitiformis]|uniref:Uncharacterized protein n=1 Tax=Cymbomonas tetramitiformis TaxID=36881 RepID=A0AAE0EWF6_9CHLO|nr:hypothetical protein CYMTET_48807 [Cymbomonas tetramitiformis]
MNSGVNAKGFTPRADKRALKTRLATQPLPLGGNWSQISKKVAFHKGNGQTIPLCGNEECMVSRLRHWHRDCPRGGKRANGAHVFVTEDVEHDFFAVHFANQQSTPATPRRGHRGVRMQYCQPVDTHMGVCTVGGAAQRINLNGFKVESSVTATPAPAAVTTGPPSVLVPEDAIPQSVSALFVHEPDLTVADKLAAMGGFTITMVEDEPPLENFSVRFS